MSGCILPPVFEWTRARRNHYRSQLALRHSLKLLPPKECVFGEKHFQIYWQLCLDLDVYPDDCLHRVWDVACLERRYYYFSPILRRWVYMELIDTMTAARQVPAQEGR